MAAQSHLPLVPLDLSLLALAGLLIGPYRPQAYLNDVFHLFSFSGSRCFSSITRIVLTRSSRAYEFALCFHFP